MFGSFFPFFIALISGKLLYMFKRRRLIVLLLIPCLLAGPSSACFLARDVSNHSRQFSSQGVLFAAEALPQRILWLLSSFDRTDLSHFRRLVGEFKRKKSDGKYSLSSTDGLETQDIQAAVYTPDNGVIYHRHDLRTWPPTRDLDEFLPVQRQSELLNDVRQRSERLRVVVTIATFNSAPYLAGTMLAASEELRRVTEHHPKWSVELIISVNGAGQDDTLTAALSARKELNHRIPITVIQSPREGKTNAMNIAAQYAAGRNADILGFTDDDVRYSPGLSLRRWTRLSTLRKFDLWD